MYLNVKNKKMENGDVATTLEKFPRARERGTNTGHPPGGEERK